MAFLFVLSFGLFIVLVFFIRHKIPEWKGKYSEKLVYRKMSNLPDEYTIFNNLLFENNGYSTQIDHLVVSPYGVFVIETKGYKGWILGGEYSEKWTQNIYGTKFEFYNPIKQNDGHVRFLRHLLKSSVDIPFIPIVVFNNDAVLKVFVKDHIVINRYSLNNAILQYHDIVVSEETFNWIVKTIHTNSTVVDKEEMRKHNENVNARKFMTQSYIKNGICPECGGKLVIRNGKFGSFYGCSNYPKCKFTINK